MCHRPVAGGIARLHAGKDAAAKGEEIMNGSPVSAFARRSTSLCSFGAVLLCALAVVLMAPAAAHITLFVCFALCAITLIVSCCTVAAQSMQIVVGGQVRTLVLARPEAQGPRPTLILLYEAGGTAAAGSWLDAGARRIAAR